MADAVVPDRLPANFDFSKPITVPDRLPANFNFDAPAAPANPDRAFRDHLKDESFLDSVWNVVKSPVSAAASIFNGDFARETQAQRQRMEELQKSGTPKQKREFAKEIILKNVPGASTVYKATHGNVPGALGDVAGMGALGGVAKGIDAASEVPVGRYAKATLEGTKAGVMNTPIIGKPLRAGVRAFQKSLEETAPTSVESSAPTPGQVLAKQSGQDWSKLSPTDQATLEKVAAAQQNTAVQTAQPPMRPPSAVEAPAVEPPPPPKTIGQQIAEEIAARKAAEAQAAPPEAPTPATPAASAPVEPAAQTSPRLPVFSAHVGGRPWEQVSAPPAPPVAPEIPPQVPEVPAAQSAAPPPVPTQSSPPVAQGEAAQTPPAPPAKPYSEMTKPELVDALFPDNPNPSSMDIARRLYEEAQKSGTAVTAKGEVASPSSEALAKMARETPQGMRKTVAKANYRAVKEGNAEPNTASPVYEATNRAIKVNPVAKALLDNGVTYSDLTSLTKPEIQSYIDRLSKATAAEGGEHPGNPFSETSVEELMGELQRAESASKEMPPPEKYAGGDAVFAGKVSKGRAMKNYAATKENR